VEEGGVNVPGRESLHLRNPALKGVLVAAGFTATGLAVLGIFLPLLPTVPLLLLATACFARSSNRFHRWLLEHRHLGPLIADYLDGGGIPMRARVTALALTWTTIPLSALYLVSLAWVRILMMAVAASLTVYLVRLPGREPRKTPAERP
jgi:uncharacterized membrane protein YbaN (DUF454 family)